jgi:hypothetical protein
MAQIAAQVPFGGVLQDGLLLVDALFFYLTKQALQLKACGDRSGSPMICMTHGAR